MADLPETLISELKIDPAVYDILPNLEFTASVGEDVRKQYNAPRHLARLSSLEGLAGEEPPFTYTYGPTGSNVNAYIIDTGIELSNPNFQGRAVRGANFVAGESDGDLNGHGTHVAGIVGSQTYGVAKEVTLVEVKVLNSAGSGTLQNILAGIEFAANDRASRGTQGVANLSLGAVYSGILNDAVNAAYETGLVVVVAAGNSNSRASLFSPSSAAQAITVGALDDLNDSIASFSNYGDAVDIFASGVQVESLSNLPGVAVAVHSGTSMASPVVAGFVATLLSKGVDFSAVRGALNELAQPALVIDGGFNELKYRSTPNRVVYNGFDQGSSASAGGNWTVSAAQRAVAEESAGFGASAASAYGKLSPEDFALVSASAALRGVDVDLVY